MKNSYVATAMVFALAFSTATGAVTVKPDPVLDAINALISSVNSLSTKITELINAHATTPPATGPTALVTSAYSVLILGNTTQCLVTNVGTAPVTVLMSQINGNTPSFVAGPATRTIAPNQTFVFGRTTIIGESVYCRFETTTPASVRASMVVYDFTSGATRIIADAR